MEDIDIFSSQESLPLSQDTFKYIWQDIFDTKEINVLDATEIKKELMDGSEVENMVEYNSLTATPSTSTATADTNHFTKLNTAANANSSVSENPQEKHCLEETSTSSNCINSNNIPPTTDWPGEYDFQISFHPQERAVKSTTWIYSEIKEKLFVNMAVPCPVNIHVKTKPPVGSVLRAMPIFSRSEHIMEVVKRCLNHSNPEDPSNAGHPAPDHIIRCDNATSHYVEDSRSKRQSVVILYEPPQVGMQYTTYLFRFMCLGSCVGGVGRRPLKVIFTLEKGGECLGRKLLDLRICACPGRDKRTEEKQLEKQRLVKRSSSISKMTLDLNDCGPPLKRQKSDSGDDESHYNLVVHQRSHYDILKKMKEALEIASMLTPEQSAVIRQRYMKAKKKKEHHQSSEDSAS